MGSGATAALDINRLITHEVGLLEIDIELGRSFKYHRPRGVFGIGAEEPNAMVQLGAGARTEPNSKATEIELFDGLVAASQNCWPSVERDLYALTGLFAPLLPAGFYYKTFMWPARHWLFWERFIRPMAGHGRSLRDGPAPGSRSRPVLPARPDSFRRQRRREPAHRSSLPTKGIQ